jgi:hypothetical protein
MPETWFLFYFLFYSNSIAGHVHMEMLEFTVTHAYCLKAPS